MNSTEQELVAGLREAVATLYRCRYSEQPLAEKLDALLKKVTGKSQNDIVMEQLGYGWMSGVGGRDNAPH